MIPMTKRETLYCLAKNGIRYEITEHPAVFNMEELNAVELPYPDRDGKNLFVRDDKKKNYYLITVRGDKRVDLKEFRKKYGLRNLSFASARNLMDILRLVPGAVTPLGLLCDEERKVTLFLDSAFGSGPVGVHPNDNTATMILKTADVVKVLQEFGVETQFVEL